MDLPDFSLTNCAAHFHVAAHHWNAPQMHSSTPGGGLLCRMGDHLYGASLLMNSRGMPGAYGYVGYQPIKLGNVRIGVLAGVRTRPIFLQENKNNWTWNPASYSRTALSLYAAGAVSYQITDKTELHLMFIPAIKQVTPATAALSISWGWK